MLYGSREFARKILSECETTEFSSTKLLWNMLAGMPRWFVIRALRAKIGINKIIRIVKNDR